MPIRRFCKAVTVSGCNTLVSMVYRPRGAACQNRFRSLHGMSHLFSTSREGVSPRGKTPPAAQSARVNSATGSVPGAVMS